MLEDVRFSSRLTIRTEPETLASIDRAAAGRGTKPSEYIRQALRTALALDGFDPGQPAPSPADAGALYDVVEGKQRFARIDGGNIAAMSYHDERPANGDWRPVQHEDSEPFDLVTKWRLTPITCIEADRVVVTYPVVDKSLEFA